MTTKVIQQGAEAKIILDEKDNLIVKDRISKSYRHPELDKQIRKQRTKAEAKLLAKANKIINTPLPLSTSKKIFASESEQEMFQIKMPFINGKKLSEHLDKLSLKEQKQIMKLIGTSIAKLHKEDIIHGDLTTSNMILVSENKSAIVEPSMKKFSKLSTLNQSDEQSEEHLSSSEAKVFFIDFGLGFISKKIEDKAVDLHLLKQALEAKHFRHFRKLQDEVFKAYQKENSEAKKIFERITAVERRGRYRH